MFDRIWKILPFLNPFNYVMLGIVDPCSLDEMLDGSSCIDHLSDKEKLAAKVFYTCAELAACSRQECTVAVLEEEAKCLKHLSEAKLDSINVYSDLIAANAAGAQLSGSMDELQEGIKCLKGKDEIELKAMLAVLQCRLQDCVAHIVTWG